MAGIIAARGSAASGIRGIAPEAKKILPIKVLTASGQGDSNDIARGIDWAVGKKGARIVNISSGGGPNPAVRKSITEAISRGALVVASSGNKPRDSVIQFPAYIDGVLAVGAIDRNGNQASYSVSGDRLASVHPERTSSAQALPEAFE